MMIKSLAIVTSGKPGETVSTPPGTPVEVEDSQAYRMVEAGTAQPEGAAAQRKVAQMREEAARHRSGQGGALIADAPAAEEDDGHEVPASTAGVKVAVATPSRAR